MDQYAVMGDPITHSKSPAIHTQFAQSCGQTLNYSAIQVAANHLQDAINDFRTKQGKGLNITVPLKQEAFELADTLSPRAQRAGAVNTLLLNADGSIQGDNTDGLGLVNDIVHNLNTPIQDQRILILGAGGAVRGVLEPIIEQQPKSLTIANRTLSKAMELKKDFADLLSIDACTFDEANAQYDIIINGTSASLHGDLPPLNDGIFSDQSLAYDMMYAANDTPFTEWAKQQRATQVADGLGMLVEQAAQSFYLWRQQKPNSQEVLKWLREQLHNA